MAALFPSSNEDTNRASNRSFVSVGVWTIGGPNKEDFYVV